MPGDPEECREHAAHCRELAAAAGASAARKTFIALAEHLGTACQRTGGCIAFPESNGQY
jgi:hypothetical protein